MSTLKGANFQGNKEKELRKDSKNGENYTTFTGARQLNISFIS